MKMMTIAKMWTIALFLCAPLGLGVDPAQAASCTQQIDQFEAAVRHSSANPDAGPTAPETPGAKLGRQPTPASIATAEARSQSRFASLVAKAKALDARGKHAACMRALNEAKRMFDLQ
jgi:hypothetical protein